MYELFSKLPIGELHANYKHTTYNFVGPKTDLTKRFESFELPKIIPRDFIDLAAFYHDIDYTFDKNIDFKNAADKIMMNRIKYTTKGVDIPPIAKLLLTTGELTKKEKDEYTKVHANSNLIKVKKTYIGFLKSLGLETLGIASKDIDKGIYGHILYNLDRPIHEDHIKSLYLQFITEYNKLIKDDNIDIDKLASKKLIIESREYEDYRTSNSELYLTGGTKDRAKTDARALSNYIEDGFLYILDFTLYNSLTASKETELSIMEYPEEEELLLGLNLKDMYKDIEMEKDSSVGESGPIIEMADISELSMGKEKKKKEKRKKIDEFSVLTYKLFMSKPSFKPADKELRNTNYNIRHKFGMESEEEYIDRISEFVTLYNMDHVKKIDNKRIDKIIASDLDYPIKIALLKNTILNDVDLNKIMFIANTDIETAKYYKALEDRYPNLKKSDNQLLKVEALRGQPFRPEVIAPPQKLKKLKKLSEDIVESRSSKAREQLPMEYTQPPETSEIARISKGDKIPLPDYIAYKANRKSKKAKQPILVTPTLIKPPKLKLPLPSRLPPRLPIVIPGGPPVPILDPREPPMITTPPPPPPPLSAPPEVGVDFRKPNRDTIDLTPRLNLSRERDFVRGKEVNDFIDALTTGELTTTSRGVRDNLINGFNNILQGYSEEGADVRLIPISSDYPSVRAHDFDLITYLYDKNNRESINRLLTYKYREDPVEETTPRREGKYAEETTTRREGKYSNDSYIQPPSSKYDYSKGPIDGMDIVEVSIDSIPRNSFYDSIDGSIAGSDNYSDYRSVRESPKYLKEPIKIKPESTPIKPFLNTTKIASQYRPSVLLENEAGTDFMIPRSQLQKGINAWKHNKIVTDAGNGTSLTNPLVRINKLNEAFALEASYEDPLTWQSKFTLTTDANNLTKKQQTGIMTAGDYINLKPLPTPIFKIDNFANKTEVLDQIKRDKITEATLQGLYPSRRTIFQPAILPSQPINKQVFLNYDYPTQYDSFSFTKNETSNPNDFLNNILYFKGK